jgi:hypothetical protein
MKDKIANVITVVGIAMIFAGICSNLKLFVVGMVVTFIGLAAYYVDKGDDG